jgi:subtilisin family serine protease
MLKAGQRFSGILIAAIYAVALLAAPAAAQQPVHKIDPDLMETLGADQSAPFFVLFKERALLDAFARLPARSQRARGVVQKLRQTASLSQLAARRILDRQRVKYESFWVSNTIYVHSGNLALARTLALLPGVTAIKKEPVFAIPAATTSATAAAQWNIAQIRADRVWPTTRGEGIVVAGIDTGVLYTHSALVNHYRGNTGAGFTHAGNWLDPRGICTAPCDGYDHGTHTMGTMVGDDGGANAIGVAPGAKWIACKGCSTSTQCTGSMLMACAQWVMDPLGDGSGAQEPDIVNNSWSGASGDNWFLSFVTSWRAVGIFPAFSAGNGGPACSTVGSPADYPNSVAAGATDANDRVASFSARGPSVFGVVKPDLTAPGVSIRSSTAITTGSYGVLSGTSMASPHVAGTVALLWAANPSLKGNIEGTEQVLGHSAMPLASSEPCGGTAYQVPGNVYGSGRVDALAATLSQAPSGAPPAVAVTDPANGATFTCPANVTMTAVASDYESGDLTSQIV